MNTKIPEGPLAERWTHHRQQLQTIDPQDRPHYRVIVVGTGMAGRAAALALCGLGYETLVFLAQDSPHRDLGIDLSTLAAAHDGFLPPDADTRSVFDHLVEEGDFRGREAGVYRLAELALPRRRPDGSLLSATLLHDQYRAFLRLAAAERLQYFPRREMANLVVIDEVVHGIVTRDAVSGQIESFYADAVVLATGGYARCFEFTTNPSLASVSAVWAAHKNGAYFANPSLITFYPFCVPPADPQRARATFLPESRLSADGLWTPRPRPALPGQEAPEPQRGYFLKEAFPEQWPDLPPDTITRSLIRNCGAEQDGYPIRQAFTDAFDPQTPTGSRRHANLGPVPVFPAAHLSLGGLWVNYQLMSNLPGLFVIGEANCADQGAWQSPSWSLIQALIEGEEILPLTVGDYLTRVTRRRDHVEQLPDFKKAESTVNQRISRILSGKGTRPAREFFAVLTHLLWSECGPIRGKKGLTEAYSRIAELRDRFWDELRVPGTGAQPNPALQEALRVADFLECADLLIFDALSRRESCGAHFRSEFQTADAQMVRDDENFCYIAAWEHAGVNKDPVLHKEILSFTETPITSKHYR